MDWRESRAMVLDVARRAAGLGLVPYTTGNFSLRDVASGYVVVTPAALRYEQMTEADIVVVDPAGQILEGNRRPSSETPLHLGIYADRPDICGVVHTHSPYLTCFATMGMEIPVIHTSQRHIGPRIPVVPLALPLWDGMNATCEKLRESSVVLLESHGAVSIGPSIELAFYRSVMAEHFAFIYHLASQIGKPRVLDVGKLKDLASKYSKV